MLQNFYQNKQSILKKSSELFLDSNLTPKIGIELEFFLLDKNFQKILDEDFVKNLIAELKIKILEKFSLIYEVEKERGASQIEVKTHFISDLEKLAQNIVEVKKFISDFANKKELIASFAAQPFTDDCGNALQFNLSLHDKNDKNIFLDDEIILNKIIFSLLENTDFMMVFLAPKTEDYLRFSSEINLNLFKKGKFIAPTNLSFGNDNRTCAIRIKKPRLEYRIAAADADIFLTLAAIILVIEEAIKFGNKKEFSPVFGNAFDEKYLNGNFCKSLIAAEEIFFSKENFIRAKMKNFY